MPNGVVFIAGHDLVTLFKFNVPQNVIIISTERNGNDFYYSLLHEIVEHELEKDLGYKYEKADQIARTVEHLLQQILNGDTNTENIAEKLFETGNLKPEELAIISRVTDLIGKSLTTEKANWMTMMEDISSPDFFKMGARQFPIHAKEEKDKLTESFSRLDELIKRIQGDKEILGEGDKYTLRESESTKPFEALQSFSLG